MQYFCILVGKADGMKLTSYSERFQEMFPCIQNWFKKNESKLKRINLASFLLSLGWTSLAQFAKKHSLQDSHDDVSCIPVA